MSKYHYRFWTVDHAGLLAAAIGGSGTRWMAERNEARCNRVGWLKDHHQSPLKDCSCGFYVHHNPIAPCACDSPTDDRHGAVGVARCWGRFEEHDLGTRWQYAKPVALVDFTGRLSDHYRAAGVTVYPDLDTLYGEWAPDRDRWADERPDWCQALNWRALGVGVVDLGVAAGNITFHQTGNGLAQVNAQMQNLSANMASLTVVGDQLRALAQALADGAATAIKNMSVQFEEQKKRRGGTT